MKRIAQALLCLSVLSGLAAHSALAAPPGAVAAAARSDAGRPPSQAAPGVTEALRSVLKQEGTVRTFPPRPRVAPSGVLHPPPAGRVLGPVVASAGVRRTPPPLLPTARPGGALGGAPTARITGQAARIDGSSVRLRR
jgi:hypothetical protein